MHYNSPAMDAPPPSKKEFEDEEVKVPAAKLSAIDRALARSATLESKLEDLIATLHIKGGAITLSSKCVED